MQKRGREESMWLKWDAMETPLEHESPSQSQVDRIWLHVLALLHSCLYHIFWPPTSTTCFPLYLSFALHLGTSRLSIPAFCMLFYGLVGLQTANIWCFCTSCRITSPSPHPGYLVGLFGHRTQSISSMVICICRVLGLSGKSVPMSAHSAYPPSCTDPPMVPPGAFSVFPTSIDAQ